MSNTIQQMNPKLNTVGKLPTHYKGKLSQQQTNSGNKNNKQQMVVKISDKNKGFSDDNDDRTLSTHASSSSSGIESAIATDISPETDDHEGSVIIKSNICINNRYGGINTSDICKPLIDSQSSSLPSDRSIDRSPRTVKHPKVKVPPLDFDKLKAPTGMKKTKQQATNVVATKQADSRKKSLSPSGNIPVSSSKLSVRNNGIGCMCTIC